MKDKDPKKTKSHTQAEATGQEGISSSEATQLEEANAHLLPFAKPYNAYFDAVHEAHRSLQSKASEAYEDYIKAARAAMEARDPEALRSAAEKFHADWTELAKPEHMAKSVSRAFDAYHEDLKAAFGSGASAALGPGCFALVAYSMAVVASHRVAYR